MRSLTVFLDFDTFLTLHKDQVEASVSESALEVNVSEGEDTPQQTAHTLPCQRLVLFALVKADSVRVEISQRRVTINLEKTESQIWERLGREKWAWVRRNEDLVEEEDKQEDASYTKEKAEGMRPLPEAAWEDLENTWEESGSSSESDQSFNEEDEVEFINDIEKSHTEADEINEVM